MNIGKRLKRYRESQGWDQETMAEVLGLKNQQAYSYYENKEDIKLSTVKDFNKKLGIDLLRDDFIEEDSIPVVEEPALKYTASSMHVVKDSLQPNISEREMFNAIIHNLSETNRLVAESNSKVGDGMKEVALSNAKLSSTNAELVKLVNSNSSFGVDQRSFVQDPAFVEFAKIVARIAVGKTYETEDEFLAQVMNKLHVAPAGAGR